MKNIDYTCKTIHIPGREGEPVKAIRLNNTETMVHHVTHGREEYGSPIAYTEHFMTGPIADRLYAYENLGYSPEELKKIVEKHRMNNAWSLAMNSVYGTMVTPPKLTKADIERLMDPDRVQVMGIKEYINFDISATKSMIEGLKNSIKNLRASVEHGSYMQIKKVIFNDPATIVFWADGSRTVVKAENEKFDPEKGLAMAISKRALGNNRDYYNVFLKHLKKCPKKEEKE